ncbi:MAG: serine hydrolase, partial [Xanthobacteraceae bacterium]
MAGLIAAVPATLISAAAQTSVPATPEAFGQALKAWAAEHRIKRAFVVVRRDGRIVHRSALGGANPDAPVHLASLSKAITAACV